MKEGKPDGPTEGVMDGLLDAVGIADGAPLGRKVSVGGEEAVAVGTKLGMALGT